MNQFNSKNFTFLKSSLAFIFCVCLATACTKQKDLKPVTDNYSISNSEEQVVTKPNVILILADDVGYEIPTYGGGQSYNTPNIDLLAANGTQFSQAHAAPLCSPSRTMLLTGKYNFRNYFAWGSLGLDQRTFANQAKLAGYKTLAAGKWQFGGGDQSIRTFGFDDYCVNEAFANEGSEEGVNDFYKSPTVYQNGNYLPASETEGKYGPDINRDYVFNFIDSNKDQPFCIYWAMNLCHKPFSPTPDDAAYATWSSSHKSKPGDSIYFPSMVKYMDKHVGQLIAKLQAMNLDRKTLVIFIGDNGTPGGIHSKWNGQIIEGGKSKAIERGTHVPMVAFMPGNVQAGKLDTSLIDLTDFLPSFSDIFKTAIPASYGTIDGVSFYQQLMGLNNSNDRDWIFCHYLAHPDNPGNQPLQRWMQNTIYKEYDTTTNLLKSGKFYNIVIDPEERKPIPSNKQTTAEKNIYNTFKRNMHALH